MLGRGDGPVHDTQLTEKIMGLSGMQRSYDANFILEFSREETLIKFTSTGGHVDVHNSEAFEDYVRLRGGHPNVTGLTIHIPNNEFVNLFIDHPEIKRTSLDDLRKLQESISILDMKIEYTLLDASVSTRLIDAITSYHAARDNLTAVLDLYSIAHM